MSVEQLDVVDVISTDKETGHVILTISDHLDWSDSIAHQKILQAKFNKYLAFIESGEILERYPDGNNRPLAIKVVFKYKPDAQGWQFLARAKQVIESAGFSLRHEVFADLTTTNMQCERASNKSCKKLCQQGNMDKCRESNRHNWRRESGCITIGW